MERFDQLTHNLCVDENGDPLRHEENPNLLAFFNAATNDVAFLEENTDILKAYPNLRVEATNDKEAALLNADCAMDENKDGGDMEADETPQKNVAKWHDDAAVKYLIHLRKVELKKFFQSTALSNMRKWQNLASQLAMKNPGNRYWSFTWKQCESKWKDLVKNYNKSKDNMSARSSGATPIRFKFFDDMDEVNKESPTVKPVSVASNLDSAVMSPNSDSSASAGSSNINDPCSVIATDSDVKKKKTKLEKKVDVLIETVNSKDEEWEAAKERRHQEALAMQRDALAAYKAIMTRLIDKL